MGGDRLLDGLRQIAPEVPYVGDLDRLRGGPLGCLCVGRGAIPAHDLHLGMVGEPTGHRLGFPAGQYIDRPPGFEVDQDGGVGMPLEQGKLINSENPDLPWFLERRGTQEPEERVLGHRHSEPSGEPGPGPAGQDFGNAAQLAPQGRGVPGVGFGQPRYLLRERHRRAVGGQALETPYEQHDHHRHTTQWSVAQPPFIPPVDPYGTFLTARAPR